MSGPCRLALGLLAASLLSVTPAVARSAEEPSIEEALAGFDDDAPAATAQRGDLEDVLEGFDDVPTGVTATDEAEPPAEHASFVDRYLELTGSTSLGVSYNVQPHRSTVGPDPTIGTYYGNLQRLRARADVQADVSLPRGVRARIQAFGYYDFAYAIHGQEKYTERVLRDYELEGEILDFWIAGRIGSHFDLKLGRQVVNWGRSDTLRVTDTLNALNNREPFLVDIEELRLPSTMAKLDGYFGPFGLSLVVIPEIRYDYDPPPGSDFFPAFDLRDIPAPPPGFPLTRDQIAALFAQQAATAFTGNLPSRRVDRWGATPELGAAATGIFSGWDLSLYVARVYQNRTTTVINLPSVTTGGVLTDDDRITLVGAGGNYTFGSWLFKAEIAWLDELDYVYLVADPAWQPTDPLPGYAVRAGRLSRLDWMAGVEYYGLAQTTLALELAHRHVFDYVDELRYLPNYVYRDNVEVALRVTSEHMNARLTLTGLGLVLVNEGGLLGATLRLSAEYELAAGLAVTGGYLHFFGDDQLPFDTWRYNDRLFAKLKYSF